MDKAKSMRPAETAEEGAEGASDPAPSSSSTVADNPPEEKEGKPFTSELQPLLALPGPVTLSSPQDWKQNNYSWKSADVVDENDHRYVGLLNQCQTCYLNSLIQTLYMVPEFRNTIYRIEPKANSKGIHHQLQRLFVQLQTSTRISLSTVDLTESFGWQNEQLYQHDVQELFRVLVEALEERWKNTPHKGRIENLFEGKIIDYVKCLKCGQVKSKPDIYLDLSLAIKADGEFKPYKSLEESLSAFIKPELLNGNNKYRCEDCNSLEDAEKGLAIKDIPVIFAIQLKRYGFDYNTLHRIKLNDRLTFPDYLDLNKYIYKEPEVKPKMSYAQAVLKPSTSSQSETPENSPPKKEETEDDSGWFNVENPESEDVRRLLQNGPYVYELFSVLIHQGSATGGHYYAYIKNMDQQRWFCFNDSSVSAATPEDVKRTFGGNHHLGYSNCSNAYMLMYRRIDPDKNESFIRTPDLPENVKQLLEQIEREEEEIAIQRQLKKEMVHLRVICNDRSTISDDPIDVSFHKDTPFSDLKRQLCDSYPTINEADVRLLKSNSNWEILGEIENCSEPPLNHIHRNAYSRPECCIMLDTKQGSHFYELPSAGWWRTAEVHLVDLDEKVVVPAKRICFDPSFTCKDLKGHLCVIPEVRISDPLNLRIVSDAYQDQIHPMILWEDDQMEIRKVTKTFRKENLQLFIDVGSTEILMADRSLERFESTRMFEILERKKYIQRMLVWLPTPDEFVKANLPVPDFQNLPMSSDVSGGESSKELSSYDVNSSPSDDLYETPEECFVDNGHTPFKHDQCFGHQDYVPPDPIQKCAVDRLNIHFGNDKDDTDTGCSSSTSPNYSYPNSNSNAPPVSMPNETEPLDPEQMGVLLKTSSSILPQHGLPPPPYSANVPSDHQEANFLAFTKLEPQFESPQHFSEKTGQDDNDDMSIYSDNTPKRRSPSPNVSEDEDNKAPPNNDYTMTVFKEDMHADEFNMSKFNDDLIDDLQQADKAEAVERNSFTEDMRPRLPPDYQTTVSSSNTLDPYHIEVLSKFFEGDCLKLDLNVDRRQCVQSLRNWLAGYLGLKKDNIQIFKFYHDLGDGIPVRYKMEDTIHDTLSGIDHLCVRIQILTDENRPEEHQFIRAKDHDQNTTSFRRERQLRIKLASESEA